MIIGIFIENYKKGGVDTFLKNLLHKRIKGNQIYLITNKNNPGLDIINKKKVKIIYYSVFSWDNIFNNYNNTYLLFICKIFYSFLFPLTFLYQIIKLYLILKKIDLNSAMIVNGGYPGGDLCLAASLVLPKINQNQKVWMNFHNIALPKYKSFLLNFYKNFIDKLILKSVEGFISVSKVCSASIKKRKYLKKVNVITIYNGHSLNKENNKINLKKKFGLSKNSKILLMMAEYDLRKGHKYIISAMEKVVSKNKNIYLLIFGYGNKKLIRNYVKKSKASKNIILNDFEKNKFSLIKQADIIVVPSQKFESFGYIAIEAMSLKKAVIATRYGGLKEIILNNKTGYLVDKNNPNLYAKKILFLLKNNNIKKKLELNSYLQYKKNFTRDHMCKRYFDILKKKHT